jgi:hypothetical protein
LLGNPLFRGERAAPQTRFKTWWTMIGQPVEYAADQHMRLVADEIKWFVGDPHPTCPATPISFKDLFLVQEEDEEETASLADMLIILAGKKWPEADPESDPKAIKLFQAADVAKFANAIGDFANDRENAMSLREFLFPTVPLNQAVTAKGASKKLKPHVDEPVPCNGEILCLKETRDDHRKIINFYVARRPV